MSGKSSDQLHRLIHSLNKQEKRHFKIFAGRHTIGEQNSYVLLFDVIEKMEVYDERQVLKHFAGSALINNFSIAKGRLYDTILRSLDVYHHNSSVDAQLWKELHFAEILYKKTLYDQCGKRLKSARKLAEKFEKHAVLTQIYAMEKALHEKDGYAGVEDQDIINILEEDEQIVDEIKTYNELWNVKARLFHLLNTKGRARDKEELERFRKMIDATLQHKSLEGLSVSSRFMYHHAYSAYYFGVADAERCRSHLQSNVDLIESNTEIFRDEPNVYFGVLTNLIYVCSRLKRYQDVLRNLKKLHALPERLDTARNEDLEVKLFSSANSLELTLYNSSGQFSKALALIPAVEQGLVRFEGKISKLREAHFCLSIAVALYGCGKYNVALKWLSRITNDHEISKSEWIYAVAQLFTIIVQMELEHADVVMYVTRNVQRYLKSRNRAYKFESVFVKFVQQWLKAFGNDTELRKLFGKLHKDLLELEQDPKEQAAFEYFDFPSWAACKSEKKDLSELMRIKSGWPEDL